MQSVDSARQPVTIVGAGHIGQCYAHVLRKLEHPFICIGRSSASAESFYQATGVKVHEGGVQKFCTANPQPTSHAIVAVNVDQLASSCKELILHGTKNILVEKPAGIDLAAISQLNALALEKSANIYLAYNRRFYSSVQYLQKAAQEEGGIRSFTFDFTEWSHQIQASPHSALVKQNWLLANSSHVIDLAFFLGGSPVQLQSLCSGSTSWHDSGSRFVGSGITDTGALFSYHANWNGPGRWGLELVTDVHRYVLRPVEKLARQKIGSVAIEAVDIDYEIDEQFKPGFFAQTKAFLTKEQIGQLCTLSQHQYNLEKIYYPMQSRI